MGYAQPGLTPVARTSGMATASMVLGIIGLCPYTLGILPLLAVIFGHIALNSINKSGGMIQGKNQAIAGLILGYLTIAVYGLIIIIAIASTPQ